MITQKEIDQEHIEDFWKPDWSCADQKLCRCGSTIQPEETLCDDCKAEAKRRWETEFTEEEREYILDWLC